MANPFGTPVIIPGPVQGPMRTTLTFSKKGCDQGTLSLFHRETQTRKRVEEFFNRLDLVSVELCPNKRLSHHRRVDPQLTQDRERRVLITIDWFQISVKSAFSEDGFILSQDDVFKRYLAAQQREAQKAASLEASNSQKVAPTQTFVPLKKEAESPKSGTETEPSKLLDKSQRVKLEDSKMRDIAARLPSGEFDYGYLGGFAGTVLSTKLSHGQIRQVIRKLLSMGLIHRGKKDGTYAVELANQPTRKEGPANAAQKSDPDVKDTIERVQQKLSRLTGLKESISIKLGQLQKLEKELSEIRDSIALDELELESLADLKSRWDLLLEGIPS